MQPNKSIVYYDIHYQQSKLSDVKVLYQSGGELQTIVDKFNEFVNGNCIEVELFVKYLDPRGVVTSYEIIKHFSLADEKMKMSEVEKELLKL